MTRKCHPFGKLRASSEAKPKDLVNEKEILRCAAFRMTAKLSL
ncbi:MAG TPA: hypothetical protein VMW72_07765 [Sedimentisphaerales bacterium]|nr:hypothetical protein [Sedimentisphaerales bacterium]